MNSSLYQYWQVKFISYVKDILRTNLMQKLQLSGFGLNHTYSAVSF